MAVANDVAEAERTGCLAGGIPSIGGAVAGLHVHPIHERYFFQWQIVREVDVVLVVFGAPKISDISPDRIAPVLADVGDIKRVGSGQGRALKHLGLVWLVNDTPVVSIELKAQALRQIPLQVVIAVPQKLLIVKCVEQRIGVGKPVFGGVEAAVEVGAETERIGQGVEVEGFEKAQVLVVFDGIFQWLDVLDLPREGIVNGPASASEHIVFDDGVASRRFIVCISKAKVGHIPGHRFFFGVGAFFPHIGEVVAFYLRHRLRLLLYDSFIFGSTGISQFVF